MIPFFSVNLNDFVFFISFSSKKILSYASDKKVGMVYDGPYLVLIYLICWPCLSALHLRITNFVSLPCIIDKVHSSLIYDQNQSKIYLFR